MSHFSAKIGDPRWRGPGAQRWPPRRTASRRTLTLPLVSVEHVLEMSISTAMEDILRRARLVKDLHPLPPVHGDVWQLGRVFVSLLVGAAQAICLGDPARNEIRVSSRIDADGRVVVEVRDDGPAGAARQSRVDACRAILASVGGELSVGSAPGRGTVCEVILRPAKARALANPFDVKM